MSDKEKLTGEALEQVKEDVADLLTPYVTELMETPIFSHDIEPTTPSNRDRIKTLFLHEAQNITPDVDIFKLDLSITPRRLRRTSVGLTVLERTQSDRPYIPSVLRFSLLRDGSLHFKKLESETAETDHVSFLEDVKASLEALPTVPYGRI